MTPRWHDNDNGVREDELQAYVDGALDGRRRAAVEAYLATNASEAARLAAYREQNIGLHALFDSTGNGEEPPLPPRIAALASALDAQLRDTADAGREARGASLGRTRTWAAAAALLLTAGGASWLALEHSGWRHDPLVAFTRQAAQATTETPLQLASSATQETAAAAAPQNGTHMNGAHQVVTWLAAQPGKPPTRLPDLEALGFALVAEQVITTASGQPAARLLYQDDAGRRVTLYMRAGGKAGQTSFTFTRDGEAAQFFWQDSHMAYSLVGKMAQDQLLEIAEAVSKSLREGTEEPAAPAAPAAKLDSAAQTSANTEAPAPADGAVTLEPEAPLPPPIETPKET